MKRVLTADSALHGAHVALFLRWYLLLRRRYDDAFEAISRYPHVLAREVSWPPMKPLRLTLLEMVPGQGDVAWDVGSSSDPCSCSHLFFGVFPKSCYKV